MASSAILLVPQIGPKVDDEEQKDEFCYGICAICFEKISIQDAALVKGCEHAYCVTCILRWATYKNCPSCPQCKLPFDSLNIHRSLDGCIHDYMFEESVCLLLRATWFVPLPVFSEEADDEPGDLYHYYYEGLEDEEDDDDLDDAFYFSNSSSSNIRIGNRRWGDSGFVKAGRKEARPVNHDAVAGSSRTPNNNKKEDSGKELKGRRAKRAMKREAADKAAAAKHEQHLLRLGRK